MHIMEVDPQRDSARLRNLIGVQLQISSLPDTMTVEEAMKFFPLITTSSLGLKSCHALAWMKNARLSTISFQPDSSAG